MLSIQNKPDQWNQHAEETVYILDAADGRVRYGNSKNNLDKKVLLYKGMTLHFDQLEWHVFEYIGDGFIDAIVIYGQADNIRPEEIISNK